MVRTTSRAKHSRHWELRWWVLSAAGLLFALGLIVSLNIASDPAQRVLRSATTQPTKATVPVATGPARSLPVELVIPSLSITTPVGQLGLQSNHEVQVPTNTHSVGWYRLGPTPGQIGSSVILGHVDSYLGPGIFFHLKNLAIGALLEVRLNDGVTTQFRVTKVVQYAKTSFPDALVYGSSGARDLNLVTCGGTFNHQTGSYESNVVVYSRLVSTSSRKR